MEKFKKETSPEEMMNLRESMMEKLDWWELPILFKEDFEDSPRIKAERLIESTPIDQLDKLSDEDLKMINDYTSMNWSKIGSDADMHRKKKIKVEELLKRRKDDGSVKGLILSGDYEMAGYYVLMSTEKDGKKAWKMTNSNNAAANIYTLEDDSLYFNKGEKEAKQLVTACRRKLKKDDIIMCANDGEEISEATGVVLTETKLYVLSDGRLDYIIEYSEMDDIDFDDDSIQIIVSDGEEVTIECSNHPKSYDETGAQVMFNLLMDIKERIENV